MEEKLTQTEKNRINTNIQNEKVGMTIGECAKYLGLSEKLVAELVKLPDFPCIKFKRRILINKLGINEWMTRNSGNFIRY